MRKQMWLVVAILLVGVGCPLEFGIGGRIDQAAAQDTKDMLEKVCPAGMQREQIDEKCRGNRCETKCVAK